MNSLYKNQPQNLMLPLCPKCGDTKNVVDEKRKWENSMRIIEASHSCTACNIKWEAGPPSVTDERGVHNLPYDYEFYNRITREGGLGWKFI